MKGLVTRALGARIASLVLATGLGCSVADAADLDFGAPRGYAPPQAAAPAFGVDPRCRIVPTPELNLVGDTARFRAEAVCQSRGLYADSLVFPEPPVFYRGYVYGYER